MTEEQWASYHDEVVALTTLAMVGLDKGDIGSRVQAMIDKGLLPKGFVLSIETIDQSWMTPVGEPAIQVKAEPLTVSWMRSIANAIIPKDFMWHISQTVDGDCSLISHGYHQQAAESKDQWGYS